MCVLYIQEPTLAKKGSEMEQTEQNKCKIH